MVSMDLSGFVSWKPAKRDPSRHFVVCTSSAVSFFLSSPCGPLRMSDSELVTVAEGDDPVISDGPASAAEVSTNKARVRAQINKRRAADAAKGKLDVSTDEP